MSTSYYLRPDNSGPCTRCGQFSDDTYIGTSSYGWCFSLRVCSKRGINNLEDWKDHLKTSSASIFDEYGLKVSDEEFLEVVEKRRGNNKFKNPYPTSSMSPYKSWEAFHLNNNSIPGPEVF